MIKKMNVLQLFIVIVSLCFFTGTAAAITLSASPNPGTMNKTVTFKIGVSVILDTCNIFINYGEGMLVDTPMGTVNGDKTLVVTHTYARAGNYTVSVYGDTNNVVGPNPVSLNLRISDFEIKRIETKFENNRPEITIKRREPVPDLFVKINFSGSGLLKGYWEVDGFRRNSFFKQLSIGPETIIKYPGTPPLPSFTPGSHIVRLVITQPSLDINFPKAVYYVTAEDYISISKIKFLLPEDTTKLDYKPVVLKWQTTSAAVLYLVHIFSENGTIPVFSAYSKQGQYRLKTETLTSMLAPGNQYYMQVIGFNKDTHVVAQSKKTAIIFND